MNKLAKENEKLDEEQKAEVLDRITTIVAKLRSTINKQSKKEKVTSVDEECNSHTDSRSTVNNNKLSRIMRELDKMEREISKELYEGTIGAMEIAAALTVSFLMEETGVRRAHYINLYKSIGNQVVIGDNTIE